MKNSVVFKFIAVFLCAVSLLGAVGSAVGIFVLTEMDLYDKTVDQVLEERFRNDGSALAHEVALQYASVNLGGCPEDMVTQHYDHSWFFHSYNPEYYSYSLLDAEGNALETFGSDSLTNAKKYTFPVSGQYMYLVSQMTEAEKYHIDVVDPVIISDGEEYVYDAIPEEGTVVQGFTVTYSDGSSESIAAPGGIGVLYHDDGGSAQFQSFEPITVSNVGGPITHILFHDESGEIIYEASSPNEVGYFSLEHGNIIVFFSTVPVETAGTAVYQAIFYDLNHTEIYQISSDEPIGTFFYDENGYATMQIDPSGAVRYIEDGELKPGYVGGVSLYGADGSVFYELSAPDGVGFVYQDESRQILFVANAPLAAEEPTEAVETVPEETMAPTEEEEVTEPVETEEETAPEEDGESSGEGSEEDTSGEASEEEDEENVPSSASAPEEGEGEGEEAGEDPAEDTSEEGESEEAPEETEEVTETETTEAPTEPEPTEAPTVPEETAAPTEPVLINGKPLDEYGINNAVYRDSATGENMYVEYVYTPMPEYTVELYMTRGALAYESAFTVLEVVRQYRSYLFPALGISLLLFAVCAVYLCCAAARKPKSEEVRAGGLNRLPLDLYLAGGAIAVTGLCVVIAEGGDYLLRQNILTACAFAVILAFLACLIFVGFCFAFVAQIKTPNGYWWRNTLCGRCLRLLVALWHLFLKFCIWLENKLAAKGIPFIKRLFKAVWKLIRTCVLWVFQTLKRCCGWLVDLLHRFLTLLPLTWQWLLAGFAIFLLLALVFATNGEELLVVLCLPAAVATILYGAHSFGTLWESTKAMSKGDLDTKVDDKHLLGCFKDFAGDLNDLADVAVVAAQKQLKSERMKTELITNVSHDIKTPLTSIINYVDLLQKPHTDAEQEQYLEVLDRQSQRLKKLIDDLMEMSKASTGNMAVEITRVDAAESVNQALGEFADKLEKAQLTPVFRHSEEPVTMMADGRLVWRVLSNLLSNAVKYALPGTRLYIDLMSLEGKVVISLKNISREELNVDAEELMERFVRGDDSRNTEGSGLGLNIAKSLMELQKGQLQLLVDGDLFKVTLIFPGA